MLDRVGSAELAAMLRGAARQVREQHERLSQLDSFGGDGDHGTTMVRAMSRLDEAVEAAAGKNISDLLSEVGWAIMGVDGGATGPLFGTLFMSMADPAAGLDALDASGLAVAFEAGLAGVQQQTKARAGDKTMLDALAPAVEALRAAVDSGSGVTASLEAAAAGAAAGAEATASMQARFGRAKNIGEKSIGHPDPGATSVSLLFQGFVEGVQEHA